MTRLEVVSDEQHWKILYDGLPRTDADERPLTYSRKSSAVKKARKVAKKSYHRPSELIVYNKDGHVSERRTYK